MVPALDQLITQKLSVNLDWDRDEGHGTSFVHPPEVSGYEFKAG
jgi:hypothetical protein